MDIPHTLILDTGPLTDFFIEGYCEKFHAKSQIVYEIKSLPGSCNAGLRYLLDQAKRRITVFGVFVEAHSHFRNILQKNHLSKSDHIKEFRKFLVEETTRMKLEEEFVSLIEIPLAELQALGPVNAAIFTLACRYLSEKVGVVADDTALRDACEREREKIYIWSQHLWKFVDEGSHK
jgi:hypothetical protein